LNIRLLVRNGFIVISLVLTSSLYSKDYLTAFEQFENLADGNIYTEIRQQLSNRKAISYPILADNPCEVSNLVNNRLKRLNAIADPLFSYANSIAEKIASCPKNCTSQVNFAEYCGYHEQSKQQIKVLHQMSEQFANVSYLFEQASTHQRLLETQLDMNVKLSIIEPLRLFKMGLTLLKNSQDSTKLEKEQIAISLAVKDLKDLEDQIIGLITAKMLNEKAAKLVEPIEQSKLLLSSFKEELFPELTRARLTPFKTVSEWQKRILVSAANIIWLQKNLNHNAKQAQEETALIPTTEASGMPIKNLTLQNQLIATCFNKMALNTDLAKEAIDMSLQLLDECRSFSSCPQRKRKINSGISIDLTRLLVGIEKREKNTFGITQSMCPVKN